MGSVSYRYHPHGSCPRRTGRPKLVSVEDVNWTTQWFGEDVRCLVCCCDVTDLDPRVLEELANNVIPDVDMLGSKSMSRVC